MKIEVVIDQLIIFYKPNKVRRGKIYYLIRQTRHTLIFPINLFSAIIYLVKD
jgi:ribosomal protein L19